MFISHQTDMVQEVIRINLSGSLHSADQPGFSLKVRHIIRPLFALGLILVILWPVALFAGGVADFGTVSKSKITLNPAGAAAIDRLFFDITAFQYEQGNILSPLSQQSRTSFGTPAQVYFSTVLGNYYRADTIKYEEGEITGGHIDLAYPTTYFTVGISRDDRDEVYQKGRYFNSNMQSYEYNALDPHVEGQYSRKTNSLLFAIPMRGFSLGVRQNYRELSYKTGNLNNAYLDYWDPYSTTSSVYPMSAHRTISGKSSYQFNDYGVMLNLSAHQPKLDVGFLVRPSTSAVMTFEPNDIGSAGSFVLQDLPFTEPGLNLTTIALGMNAGRIMAQVILEAGDYVNADESFQALMQPGTSSRNRAYDVDGFLIRLTINPFFEVAYGVRNQEIAGSLTNIQSQVIKFPVPMGDTLILTIGRQTITILDENDDTLTDGTSYSLSAEMKFGKPVVGPGRSGGSITGRGLPPKTKRLPYYMEY